MVQVPGDVTAAAAILDELSGQDELQRVQLTVKARNHAPDVVLGVSHVLSANACIESASEGPVCSSRGAISFNHTNGLFEWKGAGARY